MSAGSAQRVLLLTPRLDGNDGVSEVSRQAVAACGAAFGTANVETWTLAGGRPGGPAGGLFRSAEGRRGRLGRWAIARAAHRVDHVLVVALHLHLAPVALPLVLRGATLACFLHGIEAWRPLRTRERAAIGAASMLLANSRWTADHFTAANPWSATRPIAVCALGVTARIESPVLPTERDYALVVGRLAADERYKGHERLIATWQDVVQRVPRARLVIVGDGDDRQRLERVAAAHGLGASIVFTGRLADAERDGYYRNAAFFVMPSTGEGFGLAYLEAMSAAKPCIVAPGAAGEIVEDGISGLVVDPESPGALVAAIVTLFEDAPLRRRMGAAAAARVAADFQARHFARRFIEQLSLATAVKA